MHFRNFLLDTFQEKAIGSIEKNHSVLVSAPTGSGKTLIADYIIDKDLKKNKRIIYTAPIKALSNQKYRDFIKQYGADKIGLITGDIVENSRAQVLIMTTEIFRNMAIVKDPLLDDVTYCIMDEIHFISDEERGYIWEESIIFSPMNIRFLFLSATIPNSREFAGWVSKTKKHDVDIVVHEERPVPLITKFYDQELGITTLDKIKEKKELDSYPSYNSIYSKKHRTQRVPMPNYSDLIKELKEKDKLPCIYFVFSRAKTQEYAFKLKEIFLTPEEKNEISRIVSEEFRKISPDVLGLKSTLALRQCLSRGIAFHHGGMLPDIKHIVEMLFSSGLIKVLFATETFAVGINMPAKTVCFDSLRKFTGVGFRNLNSKEYFQISGRAGRRGIDKSGLSVAMIFRKGDDLKKIEEITSKDVLPLKSQFRLSYNTVLNLKNLHSDVEIEQILKMNFHTYQGGDNAQRTVKARYTRLVHLLEKMGYLKDGVITEIGIFTTKVFSNEIEISQFCFGGFEINEYTLLLFLGSLAFEEKRGVNFLKTYHTKEGGQLEFKLKNHPVLKRNDWDLEKVSALIRPVYEQKKFIDVLKNTTMTEGDLIRFYMQVLDKLEQIGRASNDDRLLAIVRNCKYLLRGSLEGIHVF